MTTPLTSFQQLVADLATIIIGKHITDIRALTDRDYLVIFSETKQEMLALSLRNEGPLATMITPPPFWSELPKIRHEALKHFLSKLKIDGCTPLDNHEVIILDCHKIGPDFQLDNYQLILELIKGHPNLVLIENTRIIYAHKTFGLDQARPLVLKGSYAAPIQENNPSKVRNWPQEIEHYRRTINQVIIDEQAKPWLKLARHRKRQLERKIIALELDQSHWKQQLDARNKADLLLTYEFKNAHLDILTIDGITINLNPVYSVKDNAQRFYKIYRKAKQAIVPLQEQLDLAQHELKDLTDLVTRGTPRTSYDVEAALDMLRAWKLLPMEKELGRPGYAPARYPYEIVHEGTRYLFGRNALQNDYLTFKYARPDDWFFHIKDVPGAHVIVQDSKPSSAMINFASGLALSLSKRTDGEVSYAQVQTLKKGKKPGQVLMKKSQTIHLAHLDEAIALALVSAKRTQR